MSICKENHRNADILETLPKSQKDDDGRHLCAGCAYTAGFNDGLNNKRRALDELNLPESQAQKGRHKSPQAAYNKGFELGYKQYNKSSN